MEILECNIYIYTRVCVLSLVDQPHQTAVRHPGVHPKESAQDNLSCSRLPGCYVCGRTTHTQTAQTPAMCRSLFAQLKDDAYKLHQLLHGNQRSVVYKLRRSRQYTVPDFLRTLLCHSVVVIFNELCALKQYLLVDIPVAMYLTIRIYLFIYLFIQPVIFFFKVKFK